jgi:hypothetical protein
MNLVEGILLVLLILILFYIINISFKKSEKVQDKDESNFTALTPEEYEYVVKYGGHADIINLSRPKKFNQMSYPEKLQYIIDNYFPKPIVDKEGNPIADKKEAPKTKVPEISRSNQGCTDNYRGCESWALNGECEINPEYMLYNCPRSCNTCGVSDEDKYELVKKYNKQDLPGCVYHGEMYPGQGQVIHSFYDYMSIV